MGAGYRGPLRVEANVDHGERRGCEGWVAARNNGLQI